MSAVQSFAEASKVNVTQTFDELSKMGDYIFMVVHSDNEDEKSLLRKISANPNVAAASLNGICRLNAVQNPDNFPVPNDP